MANEEVKNVKNLADSTKCYDLGNGESIELDPVTHAPVEVEAKVVSAKDYIEDTVIGEKLNQMTRPRKIVEPEGEITHLKHMETGRIYEVNPDLLINKSLRPCDETGKLVVDTRKFGRFN
jgi:hypothetical protein